MMRRVGGEPVGRGSKDGITIGQLAGYAGVTLPGARRGIQLVPK